MLIILVCYIAKVFSKGSCGDANMFSCYAKCFSIGLLLSLLVREVVVTNVLSVYSVIGIDREEINIFLQYFFCMFAVWKQKTKNTGFFTIISNKTNV